MDRFSELQIFVAVVEAGGFSAAAERLDLAKSAVSRRLAELENRLGVRLLHRTTRTLSLTDAGRAFYARAGAILEELREAEQAAANTGSELQGTLRIAAPLSFGVSHLTPALNAFMTHHPRLRLDLDLNDRRIDLVQEGFDLAARIGRLEDSSLVARRLAPIRIVTCASPGYLRRRGRPQHPSELGGHDCLHYANVSRQVGWRFRDAQGRVFRPEISPRLRANNGDTLARAATAGLGIVNGPSFILGDYVRRGDLELLFTDFRTEPSGLYALFPSSRHLATRVRACVDFLAGHFGDAPYWDRELPP